MEATLPGKTRWETEQYNTDHGMHARLAAGLREAAAYIQAHPDLPVPLTVDVHYCIPGATDEDGHAEARRIAGMLGVPAEDSEQGSETQFMFGAVTYRAVYISKDREAAYRAHMASYNPGAGQAQPELAVSA